VTSAARGDRNVRLSCRVRSKPALSTVFWVIDDHGTTVTDGQIVDEYWTIVQVDYTHAVAYTVTPNYMYLVG